jgi:hypothetical protein
MHWARRAASLAAWTAGSSNPTKIPMIARTTSSSTKVKPDRLEICLLLIIIVTPVELARTIGKKEFRPKPCRFRNFQGFLLTQSGQFGFAKRLQKRRLSKSPATP